ncbi:glutathione S-transferase N-terminal domain-containing protein, partial [Parasphingorhabdus sp.]|uniref:glutathione S-transferase N-terminal domain-containing protein n=1 Tax=Parasphingorhabdus sp. TaxID=2709688 RepID=UPI003C744702
MTELPLLYSFRRCPYAMRARMALLISETPVRLREVVLRDKPTEMIAASPKATVPVLVLPDGQVIDESLAIMHWALERNDPEHWLQGNAAESALIAEADGPFKRHLDRYKYPVRYENVDP